MLKIISLALASALLFCGCADSSADLPDIDAEEVSINQGVESEAPVNNNPESNPVPEQTEEEKEKEVNFDYQKEYLLSDILKKMPGKLEADGEENPDYKGPLAISPNVSGSNTVSGLVTVHTFGEYWNGTNITASAHEIPDKDKADLCGDVTHCLMPYVSALMSKPLTYDEAMSLRNAVYEGYTASDVGLFTDILESEKLMVSIAFKDDAFSIEIIPV